MSPTPSSKVPSSTVLEYGLADSLNSEKMSQRRGDSDSDGDDDDSDDDDGDSPHQPRPSNGSSNNHPGDQSPASTIEGHPSKANAGAIAGGVIAGILLLALLAWYWWKRRTSKNRPKLKILDIGSSSRLNGEVPMRARRTALDTPGTLAVYQSGLHGERRSLIRQSSSLEDERFSPVGTSPPNVWQVHNVSDDDALSSAGDAAALARPVPPDKNVVLMTGEVSHSRYSSTMASDYEKTAVSKTYKSLNDEKYGLKRLPTLKPTGIRGSEKTAASPASDAQSSSGYENPDSPVAGASTSRYSSYSAASSRSSTSTTDIVRPSRRMSELEAVDLALAAKEEVSDLRRRVEMLKRENVELSERQGQPDGSTERLPAYDE